MRELIVFLINTLKQYPFQVISVIIILILSIKLYIANYKDKIKRIIVVLVSDAQRELGTATGSLKFEKVLTQIEDRMPFFMKLFINKKTITMFIENAVRNLKEKIANDPLYLASYNTELTLQNSSINLAYNTTTNNITNNNAVESSTNIEEPVIEEVIQEEENVNSLPNRRERYKNLKRR